jgi:hypothetical protein
MTDVVYLLSTRPEDQTSRRTGIYRLVADDTERPVQKLSPMGVWVRAEAKDVLPDDPELRPVPRAEVRDLVIRMLRESRITAVPEDLAPDTTTYQYFIVYNTPRSSVAAPDTVLRLRLGALPEEAEILGRSGEWRQSWLLLDIYFGKGSTDADPVDRERAVELAHGWVAAGVKAAVPDDLVLP